MTTTLASPVSAALSTPAASAPPTIAALLSRAVAGRLRPGRCRLFFLVLFVAFESFFAVLVCKLHLDLVVEVSLLQHFAQFA